MSAFDATVHAMTTVATGGFSNYDASFGAFSAGAEYVCVVFMLLAALPFVRYVQLINGSFFAMAKDVQVKSFLIIVVFLSLLTATIIYTNYGFGEGGLRKALFNHVNYFRNWLCKYVMAFGAGFWSLCFFHWADWWVRGFDCMFCKIFRYQIVLPQ